MSVKFRITLVTGLLLLIVSVVVSIYTLRAQEVELFRESVTKVEMALSMLSQMAEPPLVQGDTLGMADVADRAAKGQPERVCVADMHGMILADSRHKLYNRTLPVLAMAVKTNNSYIKRTDGLWEGAAPVKDYQGRTSGVVYVTFSAHPMDEVNAQVTRQVAEFALCLTGLGAVVAYLLGVWFSATLSPLLAAIRRTAEGDFSSTVTRTGTSELDEIGRAFNHMTRLVGSEVHNLATLNLLATNLTASTTLEQFAEVLRGACWTLVDGSASLMTGDPRSGVVELVGAEHRTRRVKPDYAAFRAVNEQRPVLIGEHSELGPNSMVADNLRFASGIAAPLITSDNAALGTLAVEFQASDRPSPTRQDETTIMAVANLAAPILATLLRSLTQEKAIAALGEILLPEEIPQPEGLDIYADFVPAEVSSGLGGDYYDVLPLGNDLWGIAIGDVSGKGLDAGRYTAMTKYVVRSFALEHGSPAETISHSDEALSVQMGETRFVTLFYCIFDLKRSSVTYCCAGHLPGLLHRAATNEVMELAVGGGVVGCANCGTVPSFSEETVELQPGDTLLLYTDGIVEAMHGHEEYGLERLKTIMRANTRRSLKNMAKEVTDDVRVFAQNVIKDDMTMVLMRLSEK